MSKAKRQQRQQIVEALVSFGIEKKRAHSEVGYMLNRWPAEIVTLAVAAHGANGICATLKAISEIPQRSGAAK